MVRQGNLPVLASALANGPLTYGWTFCLKHSASRATAIHGLKVQMHLETSAALLQGQTSTSRSGRSITSRYDWTPKDGDHHRWQQEVSPLQKLVRSMTKSKPVALVADPFCGSGTTGIAALTTSQAVHGLRRGPVLNERASRRIQNWQTPDNVVPRPKHDRPEPSETFRTQFVRSSFRTRVHDEERRHRPADPPH